MSDKIYIGRKAGSFASNGQYPPISRVTMHADEEHDYTAGDDTGYHLECDNPWATQAMADALLERLRGKVYRPYEAENALLDPAAELGDAVTVAGTYTLIAAMDTDFGAQSVDIAAPGEAEIDHEYPFVDKAEREIARRLKLGAPYFGVKITRKEGLVIEKTDGETVGAKAVFNADELSFYDGGNVRVLYFDPTTGTYKFTGMLNVSDNFVVDKDGNVTIRGNLNLSSGNLFWGDTFPLKAQFSASSGGPWHDEQETTDVYRRDSYDGGKTWGRPYQVVASDGKDGSDANVTFESVLQSLQMAYGLQSVFITADKFGAPQVHGGKIFGAEIYAGDGTEGYSQMTGNGFDVTDRFGNHKLSLALEYLGGTAYPLLVIGAGSWGTGAAILKKFTTGLWIGDDSALGVGNATDISGTGFFISFASNLFYKVTNGVMTELGGGGGTAVFG